MTDTLQKICADKREHIKTQQSKISFGELEIRAAEAPAPRGFIKALQNHLAQDRYGLICEIKKASPSRGVIREDFDPAILAQAYKQGGASCLSVLTDIPYFQGADDYLIAAREAVDLPILRKDFMLDPYQIMESRALGADCILLIMAALENNQAIDLETLAMQLNMDVLIEVHNEQELERALLLQSPLIGINNRDLQSLKVDIATTERLAAQVPANRILVSESGLSTRTDLARMAACGARCFLIGESLMKQDNVTAATQALLTLN